MMTNDYLTLFFALGVLTTLGFMGFLKLNKAFSFRGMGWIFAVLGLFLVMFALAWAGSSLFEGELRAAGLGLIFFGIPGVILLFLMRFFILRKHA